MHGLISFLVGPYAFMDVFDPLHICNHTDDTGRYSYAVCLFSRVPCNNSHPQNILAPTEYDVSTNLSFSCSQTRYYPSVYALRALLHSLAPLIGAEISLGNKAVSQGWADQVSTEKIAEWRQQGQESVKDEMERLIQEVMAVEYGRLMRKVGPSSTFGRLDLTPSVLQRLALRRQENTDESKIFAPLLNIMREHKLDFHLTFRKLSFFRTSFLQPPADEDETSSTKTPAEKFIGELLASSPEIERMDYAKATGDWLAWLEGYAQRIESDRSEWTGDVDVERENAAKSANPRFVLRQWLLEEVIARVEGDIDSGKTLLAKVLHVRIILLHCCIRLSVPVDGLQPIRTLGCRRE
jgi:serine/tyrosine/threonine adenylyltransferase